MDNLKYVLDYNAQHSNHWSVDWREKNAVTEVKNQKMCGSCWSFATTGSIEGANAIHTGKLVSLSEQQMVDCDRERDNGCHGGLMDYAYEYVLKNGGLDSEEDYPYTAEEGVCDRRREKRHVVTIDGYEDVPRMNEGALRAAVARQPVAVAIEADQRPFQLYAGGVLDTACGTALDHGVLVVGYGSFNNGTTDLPYWLVKNSWGGAWGDKGYIKLLRSPLGAPSGPGQCGIAMQASYPPQVCDATTACPAGSTCCCMREFFGYCFAWACCPLNGAVCCDDHQHCCPQNLPHCDAEAGRCLAAPGVQIGSQPMVDKVPASHHLPDWVRHWREAMRPFGEGARRRDQAAVAAE
ncbi:hypothetical protein QBZ16_003101 [Prototheca wickerhamii]|uniref:Uncharacterized protein n=1 Tax=Prototheca wickerhamii TaxID=3111 RepID=A0AAD9MLA5_PROWI|nr:hypothetical protein QBZ16_003101 [Prototheca wickerhamii]